MQRYCLLKRHLRLQKEEKFNVAWGNKFSFIGLDIGLKDSERRNRGRKAKEG